MLRIIKVIIITSMEEVKEVVTTAESTRQARTLAALFDPDATLIGTIDGGAFEEAAPRPVECGVWLDTHANLSDVEGWMQSHGVTVKANEDGDGFGWWQDGELGNSSYRGETAAYILAMYDLGLQYPMSHRGPGGVVRPYLPDLPEFSTLNNGA